MKFLNRWLKSSKTQTVTPPKPTPDWRKDITRRASLLQVGGFRPSNALTASCFGEIRARLPNEPWPIFDGRPLWPVCQLNLTNAPFVPRQLVDIALLQVFIDEYYLETPFLLHDGDSVDAQTPFVIRHYDKLDGLVPITETSNTSPFRPFEACWEDETKYDYPTHDTLQIDFDDLKLGDYYDQEGVKSIYRTKIGGHPSCIQSEPWWDLNAEGKGFEYALQIDSEEKANCSWLDTGCLYIARHNSDRNRWAGCVQSL